MQPGPTATSGWSPTSGTAHTRTEATAVALITSMATTVIPDYAGARSGCFLRQPTGFEESGVALRTQGVETFFSHSSLSCEQRHAAEQAFAESRNFVIAAINTLELGIDVGDLDRAIHIDAPTNVASFLQELGRNGRRPGSSRHCLFMTTSQDAFLQSGGAHCAPERPGTSSR
jgi:ATP-dependent Lhr-like helicase